MAKKQPKAVIMTKEQAREARAADKAPNVEDTVEFVPNAKAYTPVFNKDRKYYDLWCVLIDTETGMVEIEIEETRAGSIQAAYQALQIKYTNDLLLTKSKKGGK